MTVDTNTEQQEPSIEEFVTGLMTPDGEINEDAVSKLEGEEGKLPENGKDAEAEENGPERDEHGRFKSKEQDTGEGAAKDKEASDTKDKDAKPEEGKKPDKGEEEGADKKDREAEPREDGHVKPPASMSAKDREAFYQLPTDQQKWLVEREKQMQGGASRQISEYAERVKALEPLERVLAPHRERFAHMGSRPEQVVDQLLTLAEHADRDFPGFVREQSRLRGIPLEAFGQQQSGEGGEGRSYAPDPEVAALKQQVSELTSFIQNQQQQQATHTLSSMERAVDEFSRDESYPFYSELEADMVPVVQALRASDPGASPRDILAKAYNAAAAMNDGVREKIEADRRAREDADRQRRQRDEAAKARRSAVSEDADTGALSGGEQLPASMDDFLVREATRRLRA